MYYKEFKTVCHIAKNKVNFIKNNLFGFIISSIMAGFFVDLGSFVTFTLGAFLTSIKYPITSVLQSIAFTTALSFIIMAGAELFTGNNMIMASASFSEHVTWKESINIWLLCYIGNIIGSILGVFMFKISKISNYTVNSYFVHLAISKINLNPIQLITRGIFCNILVCLAIWCSIKLKSESAKLVMIFWCILIFMVCKLEHCIANVGILTMGFLNANAIIINFNSCIYNLFFVTIGNIIGGICFIALPYYIISHKD